MATTEKLLETKRALEAQKTQLEASLNACVGGLQVIEFLLKEEPAAEAVQE